METFISDISKKQFPVSEIVSAKTIRQSLINVIQKEYPDFKPDSFLSVQELNKFREKYITDYLGKQIGELTELERAVLNSLTDKTILTDKLDVEDEQTLSFGQRIADRVADVGGSWTFIISFFLFLLLWIGLNVLFLSNNGFDPYPFILLNLLLSCLAAIQAPIIMMSQNRQEEKDRERAKKDYMVNLKSEMEIRMLHEKMDHLIINQQQELLEIQKVQIEMMNDIMEKLNNRPI